jgi:hypothetical protein
VQAEESSQELQATLSSLFGHGASIAKVLRMLAG